LNFLRGTFVLVAGNKPVNICSAVVRALIRNTRTQVFDQQTDERPFTSRSDDS
jgi:hypothetical protein